MCACEARPLGVQQASSQALQLVSLRLTGMQAIRPFAHPDALSSPPAVARLGPEDSRQLPPTPFQTVPSTVGGDTLFGSLQPLHLQAGPQQQPPLAPQQAMVSAKAVCGRGPLQTLAAGRVCSSGPRGWPSSRQRWAAWVALFRFQVSRVYESHRTGLEWATHGWAAGAGECWALWCTRSGPLQLEAECCSCAPVEKPILAQQLAMSITRQFAA